MKQIWPTYAYSPTTNVLTLTGLNIDRDQLLLVTAADRGRIMYNFADSSVTASAFTSGANTALTLVATTAGLTTTAALVIYYDDQLASNSVTVSSLPAISGTVTANAGQVVVDQGGDPVDPSNPFPIFGTVTANLGSALPAGTNRIGVVTIGAGTVTIGAGTAQIGTVTVGNISSLPDAGGNAVVRNFMFGYDYDNEVPIAIASDGTSLSVVVGNSVNVNLNSGLPAGTNRIGVVTIGGGTVTIGAGTAQIGSVTASISGTVPISISSVTVGNSVTIASLPAISGTVTANTFAVQGTAVTTSNFTSTTASTVLANFNATREVLTIFNEGAGNLHICAGATCTTIAYQVRLSAGDYYEVPNHQTTITHSAVFATAGTARVCQVS